MSLKGGGHSGHRSEVPLATGACAGGLPGRKMGGVKAAM
jgi:hypothetical protein